MGKAGTACPPGIRYSEGPDLVVYESIPATLEEAQQLFVAWRFTILIVGSGSLQVRINQKDFVLPKGSLVVAPISKVGKVTSLEIGTVLSGISYTSGFASENSLRSPHAGYFDFFIADEPTLMTLPVGEMRLVILHLKLLKKHMHVPSVLQSPFKKELLQFSFNLFIYEVANLFHCHGLYVNARRGRKERLTMEFLHLVETKSKTHHDVAFYADSLFITMGHLNKTVKSVTGKTAKRCIEDAVIGHARTLLQKDMTVLAISEELNFSNPAFFSNFFKKHSGHTPSEFRSAL